ncbi:phosphatidylinositol-specific phospholipase C domain-containing protein [Streptomyces sp. ISL-100]|uniref:phosphatidylinositol-specific phospholipase C domain-containing protein n=1 Tax=Streptomyces sp. ISL-100 TaxID=2819173 RepID=UPI001BEC0C40|nr:phosphatidylinositol-specific phospholipase C domain-containing protein [Streptomyces sp. ISL-100]MBT2398228.1 VCBS repeat-containing protein [Streptomyces sp. ISL-100]
MHISVRRRSAAAVAANPPTAGTVRRPVAHVLVMALTVGLLTIGALTGGASPALAAGPPTQGRFYIQNVAGGNQISGGGSVAQTTRPKGDEDDQQWEFEQIAGSAGFRIKSSTRSGQCLGRESGNAGALGVIKTCSATGTEWNFEHQAGERYRVLVPGLQTKLSGVAPGDAAADVRLSDEAGAHEEWFVTPIDPPKKPMPTDPTFDQMTYLTAHNAYQNSEDIDTPLAPNQPHSIQGQLDAGVRALMLDVYEYEGRILLCHGSCSMGSMPLLKSLQTITTWLEAHPDQVVTVFLEDNVTSEQLKSVFDQVPALTRMIFNPRAAQVQDQGWPRVSEMVAKNQRLLVFSDAGDDAREKFGVMRAKDWTVENYWSMGPGLGNSDWSCYTRWGDIPLSKEEPKFRRLFVMNHFRDVPMSPTYGNDNEQLQNRAERFCMPAARKKPNFLAIDQYKDGNPMAAVEALNTYTYTGESRGSSGSWKVPRLAVMPLGDSITQGVGSSTASGYRADLGALLKDRADVVDLVGTLQHGAVAGMDLDHEGHSGWRIDQLSANIETWLAAAKPNVVLLHIGTNDMNRDYQVSTAPARLGGLIDQIRVASPSTVILVASLVPSTTPEVQKRIVAYNAAIPGVIAARATPTGLVRQVSMADVTTGDLNDTLHPKDSGYSKMARAWYTGIANAATAGAISEFVDVKPAPPSRGHAGDYDVDFNGDGKADYLVVDDNGATRAWINLGGEGRGGWDSLGYVASGSTWSGSQVRFADVGGDTRADYLVVDDNGAVRAWINTGGDNRGGWAYRGYIATGSSG